MTRADDGFAPVESVFAIVMLMILTLATIQVALFLYARNVLASAAHEGARAAVEAGATGADAGTVTAETVERAAGGLVDRLAVHTSVNDLGRRRTSRVSVTGVVSPIGPIPIRLPVRADATAVGEDVAR